MKDRIHILGASGSGASTLGKELCTILPHINFDGDDYFWIKKFSKQREPKDRVNLLKKDLKNYKQWILSGAVCGWGDELKSYFDLVVFVYTPAKTRLRRLQERELERYGDEILSGGSKYEQSKVFLEWASMYDKGGLEVRSKALHEYWMSDLSCPILRIEGEQSVQERVDIVLDYLKIK